MASFNKLKIHLRVACVHSFSFLRGVYIFSSDVIDSYIEGYSSLAIVVTFPFEVKLSKFLKENLEWGHCCSF